MFKTEYAGLLALLILTALAGTPSAHATAAPTGGHINFFAAQAVPGGFSCTTTQWPTYGYDGNVGFYSNLPGGSGDASVIPTVDTSAQAICIEVVLTGQAAYTWYTISISGPTMSSTNTMTCVTDPYGNQDCWQILLISVSAGCALNWVNISPAVSGVQGTDGTKLHGIANLYYNDGTCSPPSSAPEFPGYLGLLFAVAFAAPILAVISRNRKRMPPSV